MKPFRDSTIDIVRSLAIVFMVSANMAVIAQGDVPWSFRMLSSIPAPLFIMLANIMLVLGYVSKGKHFSSALVKAFFLFIVATTLDILDGFLPLVNVDILYFLGLSLIFTSLLIRLSIPLLAVISIVILGITPYLEWEYGYRTTMFYYLSTENIHQVLSHFLQEVPQRYLIDGWFPLFPWLSIGLFGAILGKLRYNSQRTTPVSFANKKHITAALSIMMLGIVVWYLLPGKQSMVHNYIELFYPATPGFMICAMGIAYALICFIDYVGDTSIWKFIHPLGEASLFMYIFHMLIITNLLTPLGTITFGLRYFMYYLILLFTMITTGYLLRWIRQHAFYKKMPHAVKWILG